MRNFINTIEKVVLILLYFFFFRPFYFFLPMVMIFMSIPYIVSKITFYKDNESMSGDIGLIFILIIIVPLIFVLIQYLLLKLTYNKIYIFKIFDDLFIRSISGSFGKIYEFFHDRYSLYLFEDYNSDFKKGILRYSSDFHGSILKDLSNEKLQYYSDKIKDFNVIFTVDRVVLYSLILFISYIINLFEGESYSDYIFYLLLFRIFLLLGYVMKRKQES